MYQLASINLLDLEIVPPKRFTNSDKLLNTGGHLRDQRATGILQRSEKRRLRSSVFVELELGPPPRRFGACPTASRVEAQRTKASLSRSASPSSVPHSTPGLQADSTRLRRRFRDHGDTEHLRRLTTRLRRFDSFAHDEIGSPRHFKMSDNESHDVGYLTGWLPWHWKGPQSRAMVNPHRSRFPYRRTKQTR